MNFKKQSIDEMNLCYSSAANIVKGNSELYFGADGRGALKKYYGENFKNCLTLWDELDNLGGVMSIVHLPDYEDIFFVSTGFYSVMKAEKSKIYMIKMNKNKFEKTEIAEVDHLHRFGIITTDNKRYLIASSIHSGKKDMADWSKPGKILACELPMDLNTVFECELRVIKDDLRLNHGLNITKYKGKDVALIGSQSGGFILYPPKPFKDWSFEKILDFPVSDMLSIDIDGDGNDELALITPVHGDHAGIYKNIDDEWKCVYEYKKYLDFYHGIAVGSIGGVPTAAFGAKKEDMDLYIVQYDPEKKTYFSQVIESGVGPMSIAIHNSPDGRDLILSANSSINEVAIYTYEDEEV